MSQGQKSPHEDFIIFFCIVFILSGLSWAIWHFFHTELTNFVRWIRVGEIYLVDLVFKSSYHIQDGNGKLQTVGIWRGWLPHADIKDMEPDDQIYLIESSTYVGVIPLRAAFIGLMALMGGIIMMYGPGNHYRRRMGLEGLLQEQSQSFPSIQPFVKFDPRKLPFRVTGQAVPSQLPLFSEQLAPEEWIAYNEVSVAGGVMDRNRAYEALGKQLGKRWTGPDALPLHAQGLYAAFALKQIRKRKEAEDIMDGLSLCWSADKGFRPSVKLRAKIRAAIKNPKIGGEMRKYADQHAWETTAMLRCLHRARQEGGVLAPAQFLWLRGHDRTLWYPLSNLGRKSYCAEAAGALVHYTNEMIAEQKIPTPRFDEVISGFEKYLKSSAARPIPELDKKSGGSKYWKS